MKHSGMASNYRSLQMASVILNHKEPATEEAPIL